METECITCCGIGEIAGVSRLPAIQLLNALRDAETLDEEPPRAFYLFSDVAHNKKGVNNGWKFAAYLTKQKFGTVKIVGTKKNPSSGNMLTMWVWQPNATFAKSNCKCACHDNDDE